MKLHRTVTKKLNRYSGVTLIELLVAVTISLILMLGVGTIYFNSKRSYNVQEEFARLQEGARVAVDFMVKDIRMSGFMGCTKNTATMDYRSNLNLVATTPEAMASTRYVQGLTGFEAATSGPGNTVNLAAYTPPTPWDSPLPVYLTAEAPLLGSDIIIARFATGDGIALVGPKTDLAVVIDDQGSDVDISGTVPCHTPSNICVGSTVLISNCVRSRLFQVTALTDAGTTVLLTHGAGGPPAPGNAISNWGGPTSPPPFDEDSFLPDDSQTYRAVSYAYYIALNTNPTPQPALFRKIMQPGALPEELIEGVENMQIVYGVDTDADNIANQYVTAANPALAIATNRVVSARISLLLRTNNEVATKTSAAPVAKNFFLTGMTPASSTQVSTVPDRRIRKVFTTTVKLRNIGIR